MFIKPQKYISASRDFLTKSWGHGKFMASKIDSIVRQGMNIYGAVAPIAQEVASAYGGGRTKQALANVDRGVSRVSQQYQGARAEVSEGAALAEKLGSAIGGS